MILRLDRLLIDLPKPKAPSANDAAAVQELLGGKYGEMSTLMTYTFQSFNFRNRTQLRPCAAACTSSPTPRPSRS